MAIDTLLSAAHLRRELGEDLFAALVSSDNTAAVRKLAEELIVAGLPTEMTIGGRAYDILSFLRGDEKSVPGNTMVERAKEMKANQGKEEREHLLKHQGDIPAALRGEIVFVFTDDRHPGNPEDVYYVYWGGDRWVTDWDWLDGGWFGRLPGSPPQVDLVLGFLGPRHFRGHSVPSFALSTGCVLSRERHRSPAQNKRDSCKTKYISLRGVFCLCHKLFVVYLISDSKRNSPRWRSLKATKALGG